MPLDILKPFLAQKLHQFLNSQNASPENHRKQQRYLLKKFNALTMDGKWQITCARFSSGQFVNIAADQDPLEVQQSVPWTEPLDVHDSQSKWSPQD